MCKDYVDQQVKAQEQVLVQTSGSLAKVNPFQTRPIEKLEQHRRIVQNLKWLNTSFRVPEYTYTICKLNIFSFTLCIDVACSMGVQLRNSVWGEGSAGERDIPATGHFR